MSRTELLLWLALLAAFSPALAEFVRELRAGYHWSALLTPVLIGVCVLRGVGTSGERDRRGLAGLALGATLELVAIVSGTWTLAWLGLALALVGLACFLGRPAPRVAMLAFGLVPIPVSLLALHTPKPESALLAVLCPAWRAVGVDFSCIGPVAQLGDRSLELVPADIGLALAAVLAQLGWFAAVSQGRAWPRALRSAALFAAATVVLQPAAIAVALGLLAAGSKELARVWLGHGVWLSCAIVTVAWSLGTNRHQSAVVGEPGAPSPQGKAPSS